MWTELYWVDGPWPGKLALAARPRGGDWLEEEMAGWRRAGVDTVLSLLTPEEEQDLELKKNTKLTEATHTNTRLIHLLAHKMGITDADIAAALADATEAP